jgi:hypothetical protein
MYELEVTYYTFYSELSPRSWERSVIINIERDGFHLWNILSAVFEDYNHKKALKKKKKEAEMGSRAALCGFHRCSGKNVNPGCI